MTDYSEGDARQRRRFPRIVSQKVLLVRKLSDQRSNPEEFAKSRTMGLNGCSFVSGEALGAGSLLEIMMSLGTEVVRTQARVIYETKSKDGYDTGVEFLDLSQEDMERISHLFEPPAGSPK